MFVEEKSGEKMLLNDVRCAPAARCLRCQERQRLIEHRTGYDRLVLAAVDLILVLDLADVDRVRQQMIEVAPAEWGCNRN
ncbi:hypothetical protein EN817_20855 [Mesorhizobium sp. M3A.F.Ca.ET.174.01.1.1]|nr:hypothetical protein EN818_17485 [Mesorhizobium sp. M3A.F.Ca.ET.175.01.1.1]TGT23925.1 hypothetical protein EN817_20855 [Mesorhizobium sp. M3A.F.Ca.ET.174.01.1.1]